MPDVYRHDPCSPGEEWEAMKISRRSGLKALGSLPFVGKSVARQVGAGLSAGLSGGYPAVGTLTGRYAVENAPPGKESVQDPIMQSWQAHRLAMKIPAYAEEIREYAIRNLRQVHTIDPDIDVHRSISLAAKICYQRQRNVQRMLDNYGAEPDHPIVERTQKIIRKLMYGK
jgi:hypothetical protein